MRRKTQNQLTLIVMAVIVISLTGFLLFRGVQTPTRPSGGEGNGGGTGGEEYGGEGEGGKATTGPQTCGEVCQREGYAGAVGDNCIQITNCASPDRPLVGDSNFCGTLEVCCCQG